jgi:hypothetical protein
MDFVSSREEEKKFGWRTRVGAFLRRFGTTVYDPWNKPPVAGMGHYGKEDEFTARKREQWTYDDSEEGDRIRSELCEEFWPTAHIDLRMTDTADFVVAYCPTNIYSVGTVHEIVTARSQHKPVLLVSAPVEFVAYEELREHLIRSGDRLGQDLLARLEREVPLRLNPKGIPSLWYMAINDPHYFFDGFGFGAYREAFGWEASPIDEREEKYPPRRPLLPYLERLNERLPKRYDLERGGYVENPDWLIFDTE